MSVIINELEIVVEQPAPAAPGAAPPPPPQLRPTEIAQIEDRRARMRFRLAAH